MLATENKSLTVIAPTGRRDHLCHVGSGSIKLDQVDDSGNMKDSL